MKKIALFIFLTIFSITSVFAYSPTDEDKQLVDKFEIIIEKIQKKNPDKLSFLSNKLSDLLSSTEINTKRYYLLNSIHSIITKLYIFEDIQEQCTEVYGSYIIPYSKDKCICKEGYTWNSTQTSCIKKTTETLSIQCINTFGEYSIAHGINKCVCESGYKWNIKRTQCVR